MVYTPDQSSSWPCESNRVQCQHIQQAMVPGSEIRKNFAFIVYQYHHEREAFFQNVKLIKPVSDDELFVCVHCSYAGSRENVILHQVRNMHMLSFYFHYCSMYCLWCNDMVYSPVIESLSNMISGFENSEKALPTLACIMNEVPVSSVSFVHKGVYQANPALMGMKGLLNLGQTDGLNSIIQLYAHLPFIRDYFFSDKHSSMHCFLRSNTTNREFPTCFSCCFSELMKELYADNNNTFVNPKDIFHFVLTSLLQRQPLSNVTFRNYLYIFINKLALERNAKGEFILQKKLGGFIRIPGTYVKASPVIDLATCFHHGSYQFSQNILISIYIEESYNGEVKYPEKNFSVSCEERNRCGSLCRDKSCMEYNLYGVIWEKNQPSAHYTCVIKQCGRYFLFDDETVSEVNSFYEKLGKPRVLLYLRHAYLDIDVCSFDQSFPFFVQLNETPT